jgi:uncharacterized protein (DUF58 family)
LFPQKKGRRHLLRLIRELLAFEPQKRGTDIQHALAYFNHVQHRRAIVFLLTDFLHSFGESSRPAERTRDLFQEIGQTNVRHDLVCLHLHDARESRLPAAGLLTIEDIENGETFQLDTTSHLVRQAYATHAERRLANLDRALSETGVDILRLENGDDFGRLLQHFFERRRRR